jgi:glycosyltransferase involved in cell wall biosynthesis
VKILAVNHDAILSADRGLYRALKELHGVHISLLLPSSWQEHFGPTRFEPERSPLPVFVSKTLFSGRSHRAVYLSLGRILKKLRPDILWVNGEPESYLSCQAVLLRNRFSPGSKLVFSSYRNVDYTSRKFPYKLSWLNALAEKYVLSHADHCIAHNQTAKEIYQRKGFEAVTVIPPAVDTEVFRKTPIENLKSQLGLQGFVIGYIGRFVPEKGVDLLLRAVSRLDFEYRLLLVGGGPAKAAWQRLASELGLEGKVSWIDPVRHSELPRYLSCVDVLVLPSRTTRYWKEQFGRILIEAMACEVPVIGSSSGEIPNVIGDAGLVFREGDENDLCAGLSELNANMERRFEFVQRGLMRVKEHFSIPVVAAQYEKLFGRLIQM